MMLCIDMFTVNLTPESYSEYIICRLIPTFQFLSACDIFFAIFNSCKVRLSLAAQMQST
jgi:hypothetical protein